MTHYTARALPVVLLLLAVIASAPRAFAQTLVVTKTNDTEDTAELNESFEWSMAISNTGGAAAVFNFGPPIFVDQLPHNDNITYGVTTVSTTGAVSGSIDCSISPTNSQLLCITFETYSIGAGATSTVTVTAQASAAGTYTNPEPGDLCRTDPANAWGVQADCAPNTVTVGTGGSDPDLTATKTNDVSGATVTANGPFDWSIEVLNGGGASATFSSGETILTDNLPNSNVAYGTPSVSTNNVSGTGTVACAISSFNLSCTASGGTVVFGDTTGGFTVDFSVTATAGTTYVNPRAGGSCAVDPNGSVDEGTNEGNNGCSDSVAVTLSPDLTATKTNNTSSAGTLGEPFIWTIVVNNIGAGDFTLSNPLPILADTMPDTNMTYGTPTLTPGDLVGAVTCSVSSSTLSCVPNTTATLPGGGSFTVALAATPQAVGTFDNPRSAGVCAADNANQVLETNEANNACSDSVMVTAGTTGPDLLLTKNNDVSGVTELAAEEFTWSLTLANGGDEPATFNLNETILLDNLPSGTIAYQLLGITSSAGLSGTGTPQCSVTNNDLTCTAGGGSVILAPGTGSFTVEIEATPSATGNFANPRGGGTCAADPANAVDESTGEGNNACSDTVQVNASPDLTATKTNNVAGSGTVGVPFTWTITVENVGGATYNAAFASIILLDQLPNSDMTYGAPLLSAGDLTGTANCTVSGAFDLTCITESAVTLPAGGSFSVTIEATPTANGVFDNPRSGSACNADQTNSDLEINETNNACSDSVTVSAGPDLTITKTDDVSSNTEIAAGPFTWSLQVSNLGEDPASFDSGEVILIDNLPDSDLSFAAPTVGSLIGISGTGSISCAVVSSNLSCSANGGTVLVGATTGTLTVKIAATPSAVGDFDNPRAGGACEVDPNNSVTEDSEANNSCIDTVSVGGSPDAIATKSNDAGGAITVGVPFNWTIKLENIGSEELIFPMGETLLLDSLPDADLSYGTPTISDSSGTAGTISCLVNGSSDLECTATTAVGIAIGGHASVTVSATPATEGPFVNPRSGGICTADPSDAELETDEANNDCVDVVEVALFVDGFESGDTDAWN